MEQRYPVYAEADVSVISGDGPHENVVDDILLALPEQYRQVAGTIAPADRVAPEGQGKTEADAGDDGTEGSGGAGRPRL